MKICEVASFADRPQGVTQIVTNRIQDSGKKPVKQGAEAIASEPNKVDTSTFFDFAGKNLTPYGGLLPVARPVYRLQPSESTALHYL